MNADELRQSRRRLVGSSADLVSEERFDRVIHALAQLPDDVELFIWGDGPERSRLNLLAEAYGVSDRLTFTHRDPMTRHAALVYPSSANARSAPLRPRHGETSIVIDGELQRPEAAEVVSTVGEFVERFSRRSKVARRPRGDDGLREQRVAVITNLLTHYRVPLFNGMAARLESVGGALKVFYCARAARDRDWLQPEHDLRFESELLPSFDLPVRHRAPRVPLQLVGRVQSFRPTVLVAAGLSPFVAGRIGRFARAARIPFGVWSGELPSIARQRSSLRRHQRRRLAARASFGLAYGSASADYLYELDPGLPVVYARNSSVGTASARKRRAHSLLELAFVGDLTSARKGADIAIDALKVAPDVRCRLSIVGGGRLLPTLVKRAEGDPRVEFLGPLPASQAKAVLERSDVFLFPSREDVFGLALVEAMAAEACVITSSEPGATRDLCVSAHNSLVIDGFEPEAWGQVIRMVANEVALRNRLAEAARHTIETRWTIEHAVDAMLAGVRLGVLRNAGDPLTSTA